ncbi:MAG: class I SAM-dependent methyltransferase [bacterium]
MEKTEQENIRVRYLKRDSGQASKCSYKEALYSFNLTCERERIYQKKILKHFRDKVSEIRFLEIGAGFGYNLHFIARMGIPWANIWANELLDNRIKALEQSFPTINIIPGDALDINENLKFDLILISTVYTSILNNELRRNISEKALNLLENGGMILLYDFIYDNPGNKDVKSIKKKDIKSLFNEAAGIEFSSTTLAPPIGRRIGNSYNIINNLFPFLRSHLIASIYK